MTAASRWFLSLLLFAACAARRPPREAETFVQQGFRFDGPRQLTVVGTDNDISLLESRLLAKGFQVQRGGNYPPAELGQHIAPTRYVAIIRGFCNGQWLAQFGAQTVDLEVQVFDAPAERVFVSKITEESECPEGFYRAVAEALDRNWAAAR